MPAPVPINIRYGNPQDIANLGLSAGSAAFSTTERRRAEDAARADAALRMQLDAQLVQSDLNNRAEGLRQNNEINFRTNQADQNRDDAMAMQSAAGYGDQLNSQAMEEITRRNAAKSIGNLTSTPGKATQPVQLVPAEGDVNAQNGQQMLVEHNPDGSTGDTYMSTPDGRVMKVSGSDISFPSGGVRAGQTAPGSMVTPQVRDQMDYVKALQGKIPGDQWNAMWIAAKSGQLKMDQLIDDSRQAIPKPPNAGRMDALERNQDRQAAEAAELDQVSRLSSKDQALYARRKFNMQDPDIYSDQDALDALQSRSRQLAAIVQPMTNSNGKSITGGNFVAGGKQLSPDEARLLPPGTWFVDANGNKRQRR